MLKPFLIVGVGGSGGKTLRALRQILELKLEKAGWEGDFPDCWQLIHVDSPIRQEEGPFPKLPEVDYLGLVSSQVKYRDLYELVFNKQGLGNYLPDLEKVMPDPKAVGTDITGGAGRYRGIGRQIALSAMTRVSERIITAYGEISSSSSDLKKLTEKFGGGDTTGSTPRPQIIVITSMSGGSGAGQFIEVTEAIKSINPTSLQAGEIFSVIYAPDVFTELFTNGTDSSYAANTIFSIADLMSGLWSGGPSEAERALYTSQGINIADAGDPRITLGPTFNYIVGRKNTIGIDFGSQNGTYKSVAQSLSKWITDITVQSELTQYAIANWHVQAASANSTPDSSRLKDDNTQSPPFSSLGFGRVSLGMELFRDYASERLARGVIETLLYKHAVSDPTFAKRTEEEWIDNNAKLAAVEFMRSAGIYEETENNDQIIDAIRPVTFIDTETRLFTNKISEFANQGLDPKTGGKSIPDWQDSIQIAYTQNIQTHLDQIRVFRLENVRNWVSQITNTVSKEVAKFSAMYGLPVTSRILSMACESLLKASSELRDSAQRYEGYAATYASHIGEALKEASSHSTARIDHPSIDEAIHVRAGDCLTWSAEAELHAEASKLVKDFVENFLTPLKDSIVEGRAVLYARTTKPAPTDDHGFEQWPQINSTTVPTKFNPALNEKLLIDTLDYPREFEAQIESTVSGTDGIPLDIAIQQICVGGKITESDEIALLPLIKIKSVWVPQEESYRPFKSNPVKATFGFDNDPTEYISRAKSWIDRPGTSLYSFTHLSLKEFLDPNRNQQQFHERLSKFEKCFTSAFESSAPLVSIDEALLLSMHNREINDNHVLVSQIPFAKGDDVYEIIKRVVNAQYPGKGVFSDSWFEPASNSDNIEIFTQLKTPVQPMVMTSLMEPLTTAWRQSSGALINRESFIQWRTPRPLLATIPASANRKKSMLRGWFVAKALGHLDSIKNDELSQQVVSIYTPGNAQIQAGHINFPSPLLAGQVVGADIIGPVFRSLIVALAEVASTRQMNPLYPYHRLLDLDPKGNFNSELNRWITNGWMIDGALPPKPERAGTMSSTMEERKQALKLFFTEQKEEFLLKAGNSGEGAVSLRARPLAWEMRREIVSTLDELCDFVGGIEAEDSGA